MGFVTNTGLTSVTGAHALKPNANQDIVVNFNYCILEFFCCQARSVSDRLPCPPATHNALYKQMSSLHCEFIAGIRDYREERQRGGGGFTAFTSQKQGLHLFICLFCVSLWLQYRGAFRNEVQLYSSLFYNTILHVMFEELHPNGFFLTRHSALEE